MEELTLLAAVERCEQILSTVDPQNEDDQNVVNMLMLRLAAISCAILKKNQSMLHYCGDDRTYYDQIKHYVDAYK